VSVRIANETELIQTYLAPLAAGAPGAFGLTDDAALIVTEPGFDLVVSTDPVIAGVHFFADDGPRDIAWKALAVNVSDLAAKGAEPMAYTMALAFPEAPRRDWMADFSAGLMEAQQAFGCHLIGGDTDRTPGPLSVGITAFGKVPRGQMVSRSGAKIGDHVFVTGTLGDLALGLKLRQAPEGLKSDDEHRRFLVGRYLRPLPRLAIAPLLRLYASAALDVSDGLLKDATRLASGAGAALEIGTNALPLSNAGKAVLAADARCIVDVVSGGDDYEILCTVPSAKCGEFIQAAARLAFAVTEIGVLAPGTGVSIVAPDRQPLAVSTSGYDHFTKA
jgi:thiamine-monophosphate kinase